MQNNLKRSVLHWHHARRGGGFFRFINCHLSWGSRLKLIGSSCGAARVWRGHHWYKFKHYLLSGLTQTNSSVVQLITMSQTDLEQVAESKLPKLPKCLRQHSKPVKRLNESLSLHLHHLLFFDYQRILIQCHIGFPICHLHSIKAVIPPLSDKRHPARWSGATQNKVKIWSSIWSTDSLLCCIWKKSDVLSCIIFSSTLSGKH